MGNIFEDIGRNLGDVVVQGDVATATGTTMDSNDLIFPLSEQLKGYSLFVYEGGGNGQYNTVIDYTVATKRVTISPPFSTVPSANAKFLLFQSFKFRDYDNAISRALGIAKLEYLEDKVGTLLITATQSEYTVPSGFEFISNLRLVPSGHTDYGADDEVDRIFELPERCWRLESNVAGTRQIVFDSRFIDLDVLDEESIRILGQARAPLTASYLPVRVEEYVIAQATALLAVRKISENTEWQTKFSIYKDLATQLLPHIQIRRHGRRV